MSKYDTQLNKLKSRLTNSLSEVMSWGTEEVTRAWKKRRRFSAERSNKFPQMKSRMNFTEETLGALASFALYAGNLCFPLRCHQEAGSHPILGTSAITKELTSANSMRIATATSPLTNAYPCRCS